MSGQDNTPENIDRDNPQRDDPMLAAEYSLGLLEGEELLSAKGKLASDDQFAWRKDWWDNWFAPWSDEVAGMEPSADVWSRISAEVNGAASSGASIVGFEAARADATQANADIAEAEARAQRWRLTAGLTSAAAAVMLAVMVFAPGTGPAPTPDAADIPQIAAADPLVAQVPIGETGLRLDVTYIPETETMLVGAVGLTADGVHDHELWLVPADGSDLQSLGVVAPGEVVAMELPQEITGNLGDGVNLVLTREPIGGKPEGQDAGPVVAEGTFAEV